MKKNGNDRKNGQRCKKIWTVPAACFAAVCLLAGCGAFQEEKYTQEQLGYLAKLEIYEAGTDTLLKTIEDEETLYQYNYVQVFSVSLDEEYDVDDYDDYEKQWEGMKETAESSEETYYIVEYKYPIAIFGGGETEKTLTVTLYQDTDIIKGEVAQESIKNMFVPKEFRTYYYEMSEEESDFYESLVKELQDG